MKISEVKLNEKGFFSSLFNLGGETPTLNPQAGDVENRAKQQFMDRMSNRAFSSFQSAWNNQAIDINAKGMSGPSAAPSGQQGGGQQPGAQGGGKPQGGQQPGAQGGGQPAAGQQDGGMWGGIKGRLKGMFGGGKGTQPGAASPQPGQGAAQPQPSPAGVKAPVAGKGAKPAGDTAKAAGTKQGAEKPQVDVNVDKAVNAMRTLQPSGTKPLPAKNAAELNKTLQYVSKNKDYLLIAADKINKFNQAGYDMKPFHKSFMGQFALGKKQKTIQEAYFISEELFLTDSKYGAWNTMLYNIINEDEAAGGGQSPGAFMYAQIKQMLRGYDFEKRPDIVKIIQNSITNWENAFKAQVSKKGGQWNGKFDGNTQKAFNAMMQDVANIASSSQSAGSATGKAPAGQPKPAA